MLKKQYLPIFIIQITLFLVQASIEEIELSQLHWERNARLQIEKSTELFPSLAKMIDFRPAKNIILFIGDGMGLPTIAAGRFYKGEVMKKPGSAVELIFEKWPFSTMCRTYDIETMVTDSASSATAYHTGTKTRTGMLGLTAHVLSKQCKEYSNEERTESALTAASKIGKATGIVTTSRVTHASPAGAFGHAAFRDWESDADISKDCSQPECSCRDLSFQLALENQDMNVILGGGWEKFYPQNSFGTDVKGERLDNRTLALEWLEMQKAKNRKATFVKNPSEFSINGYENTDYLLGLLAPSHLPFESARSHNEPSLANLTKTAIKLLRKYSNGFFLFVEGARIDHAHHTNEAKKSMIELLAFEEAIQQAIDLVDLKETLLIVTADHSHSFELVGEPNREDSILSIDKHMGKKALDERSMIPAGYMNGPGATINRLRLNLSELSDDELKSISFKQPALIPFAYSSHAGEDVAVYAVGPFSWLFHTTIDNTFIAHAMKYAMCLEPYALEKHCSSSTEKMNVFLILLTYNLIFPLLMFTDI